MQLTLSTENLRRAITLLSRVATRTTALPVLGCICLKGTKKEILLEATNLDVGIRTTFHGKVDEEGEIALPADVIVPLVGTLQSGMITITEKNNKVTLETKNNNVLIAGVSAEDFPSFPSVEGGVATIPVDVVVKGIQSVLYAASMSTIKPELASVYVYHQGKELVFVATDAFRLAEKRIPVQITNPLLPILIPLKNTPEILRCLSEQQGTVQIIGTKNQLAIIGDGVYITTRIIDGVFPDYQQIVPQNPTTEIVVLRQELIDTLKQIHIFSDSFNKTVLSVEEGRLSLSAQASERGETSRILSGAMSGEPITISLNERYLLDGIQEISEDSVTLSFFGPGKPVIIRGVGDHSFMYLVSPMNR